MQAKSSSTADRKDLWGRLWRLKIPNVAKNFLWWACHEILPTKASLFRRKVTTNDLCPIFTLEEETCFHILWSCPSARDVWNGSIIRFHKSSLNGPSFRIVVEEMMRSCEENEFQLFVEIARQVWFRRNEVVHGGPFTHPTALVQQAREVLANFSVANN
jgi:hypothetical protein